MSTYNDGCAKHIYLPFAAQLDLLSSRSALTAPRSKVSDDIGADKNDAIFEKVWPSADTYVFSSRCPVVPIPKGPQHWMTFVASAAANIHFSALPLASPYSTMSLLQSF